MAINKVKLYYGTGLSDDSKSSLKDDEMFDYRGRVIKKSDAVFIEYMGSHMSIHDKDLVIDCITKKYVHKRDCRDIFVGFNKDGKPIEVGFTISQNHAFLNYQGTTYRVNDECIPLDLYTENLHNGVFYLNSDNEQYVDKSPVIYRKVKNSYSKPTGDLKKDYMFGLKSATYKITEGKKYTFGIEFETIYGLLPRYLDKYLNYNAVHDGSLRGPEGEDPVGGEYVTGVLIGDNGFLQTKRLSYELTRRCKIDKRCGMHLHLSNIEFSKENLVALYKVYFYLEQEIFKILPKARYSNEYCRKLDGLDKCLEKQKNSTLDSVYEYKLFIDNAYTELFKFVSDGYKACRNYNKKTDHPLGFKCGYKHSSSRYCWINFVPAIFDTRHNPQAKTIEIRNHSATTSYRKTKYWTLIHMGILWYVENYKRDIFLGNIPSLEEIMTLAYPRTSSNIINYINERKTLFASPKSSEEHKKVELEDYTESVDNESLTIKGALQCV